MAEKATGRGSAATPGTPATVALTRAGIDHTLHPYVHDPAETGLGLEAVARLGVSPDRIFKTLVVDTGSGLAVAVVPVSAQVDLKALAGALGVVLTGGSGVKRQFAQFPGIARAAGCAIPGKVAFSGWVDRWEPRPRVRRSGLNGGWCRVRAPAALLPRDQRAGLLGVGAE